MKHFPWKPYAAWIALAEGIGALSGFLTRRGMEHYTAALAKPPLSPPSWVFPVVWVILFALMGISAGRIWLSRPSPERSRGLAVFLGQLAANFFWSILFFGLEAHGFALLWLLMLWGLIGWMILTFRQVDRPAAWLQVPYLLWVTFAAYLNLGVWVLNR